MEKQIEVNLVTERNLSLTARLLLVINRKQLELNSMKLDSGYADDYYKYTLEITGDDHMLHQVIKVIAKQIGVFEVKAKVVEVFHNVEMAMA